jgi:hypothetical protein
MSASPSLLKSGPSKPATIGDRLIGIFEATMTLLQLYMGGIRHALWVQLTNPNPISLLNPVVWRNLIVESGLPKLLILGDQNATNLKREGITS